MRNILVGLALGIALMGLLWVIQNRESPSAGVAMPPLASSAVGAATRARGDSTQVPARVPPTTSAQVAPTYAAPPAEPSGAPIPGSMTPSQIVEAARRDPTAPIPTSAQLHKPGQLSTDAVRTGIAAARPAVSACYEEALQPKADRGGKLLVEFVIAQDGRKGRIREAKIDEEGSDPAMLNPFLGMCVLKALGEVEYPAPEGDGEGEIVVRFPFQMNPGKETPK